MPWIEIPKEEYVKLFKEKNSILKVGTSETDTEGTFHGGRPYFFTEWGYHKNEGIYSPWIPYLRVESEDDRSRYWKHIPELHDSESLRIATSIEKHISAINDLLDQLEGHPNSAKMIHEFYHERIGFGRQADGGRYTPDCQSIIHSSLESPARYKPDPARGLKFIGKGRK
jgi:hypothetical protein